MCRRLIASHHVVHAELLASTRTLVLHAGILARRVGHDLNRAHRLLLIRALSTRTEALARLIHIEGIRAVLANFARAVHGLADKLLARHHWHIICFLRIRQYTQVLRLADILHHQLIHLQLLESTLARGAESLTNARSHLHRFKGALSCAVPRIIDTALDKF